MNQDTIDFFNQYKNHSFTYSPLPNTTSLQQKFHWIMFQSGAPWLKLLGIDAPYRDMLSEAQNLKDRFVYHRNEEGCHRGWRSLAIHGIASDKTNVPETYGLNPLEVRYSWTDIQDHCPITVDFFKNKFPYKSYQRLRFMLLEAGGYIMPHSDSSQCFLGAAINISLNNPPECRMTTVNGTVPFLDSGSVIFFNNYYKHAVWNASNQDRYHIIVHGAWDEKIMAMVVDSYQSVAG